MVATVTQLHSPAQEIERLQSLFAKQKAAFRHTPMPTAKARIEQLNKLKAAVIRHKTPLLVQSMKILAAAPKMKP